MKHAKVERIKQETTFYCQILKSQMNILLLLVPFCPQNYASNMNKVNFKKTLHNVFYPTGEYQLEENLKQMKSKKDSVIMESPMELRSVAHR